MKDQDPSIPIGSAGNPGSGKNQFKKAWRAEVGNLRCTSPTGSAGKLGSQQKNGALEQFFLDTGTQQ
jgi:hypothetical protein